jgi:antitoxin CptB
MDDTRAAGEDERRMRWASRRGMLELDLLLEPFVRECYSTLDDADRERYRLLMGCEDQELFAWLLGREAPVDADLGAIVERILNHARHRPVPR